MSSNFSSVVIQVQAADGARVGPAVREAAIMALTEYRTVNVCFPRFGFSVDPEKLLEFIKAANPPIQARDERAS